MRRGDPWLKRHPKKSVRASKETRHKKTAADVTKIPRQRRSEKRLERKPFFIVSLCLWNKTYLREQDLDHPPLPLGQSLSISAKISIADKSTQNLISFFLVT